MTSLSFQTEEQTEAYSGEPAILRYISANCQSINSSMGLQDQRKLMDYQEKLIIRLSIHSEKCFIECCKKSIYPLPMIESSTDKFCKKFLAAISSKPEFKS